MNKRGLGKGLGALLGDEVNNSSGVSNENIVYLNVNQIDRFENQPRKHFDEEKLKELSDSIITHGIVSPIIVNNADGRYVIIAGERRYRAARLAGLDSVPVIVKNITDKEQMEISIVENLQREDLSAIEEAKAIRLLMDEYMLTQEDVAGRISRSRSAVANTLRLLTLPEVIQEKVISGELSAGHARTLVSLPDDQTKLKLTEAITSKGLSVRDTEKMISKLVLQKKEKPLTEDNKSPKTQIEQGLILNLNEAHTGEHDVKKALEELSYSLGVKISQTGGMDKGKLIIEYKSYDELLVIYEKLQNSSDTV